MKKNNAFKILLSGVAGSSVILAGYYTFLKPSEEKQVKKESSTLQTTGNSNSTTIPAQNNSNTNKESGKTYKDGTYKVSSTKSSYGEIQLEVTITGGKLTKIEALKYPTRGDSKEINEDAIPKYVEQAIAAQTSDLKLVSGATETFAGFTDSLQKALLEAE